MLEIYTNIQALAAQLKARLSEERGQTMAEYAVILAVITVGIIAAITALSGGIEEAIDKVVDTLNGEEAAPPAGG